VVVVGLGYRAADVPGGAEGFGFLAPRGEGLRVLGCLWDSSIFPGRAPAGKILLRAMVGGAVDRERAELDDDTLVGQVREDLRRSMGIEAEPERVFLTRWPRGIPQYLQGHGDRLSRLEGARRRHPGLHLTGNAYRGVALNSCVTEADRIAREVLEELVRTTSASRRSR
jgi:oxygen-dependent protoporphyrinogen oxidase